jgi:hypothetical protein
LKKIFSWSPNLPPGGAKLYKTGKFQEVDLLAAIVDTE